ncbi:MAG: hypothetical protein ACR2P4_10630 [Gammaproteobacteria bacterium]
MRFPHCIRAAPFEFCIYGYAAFSMVAYVGGLVGNASGIPVIEQLSVMVVVAAIFLGWIPAFFAVGAAPLILLFRRCIWPRRSSFCIYEFALHLIITGGLMSAIWYLFYMMAMIA